MRWKFWTSMIGMSAASVATFAACAPVTLLNSITPSGSYKLAKDIAYGDHARQKYDVYQPDEPRAGAPVIVFVYGGSWDSGKKSMYKFVAEAFASNGYTTVVPDYRLYPEVKYPAFVNDTADAVASAAKRFPKNKLILVGHSAGAYNAVKVTVDHSYLDARNVDACEKIAGTVGLAGPYGDPPMDEEPYIIMFPDRLTGEDGPINNIDGIKPPLFLAIGDKDDTVAAQHGITLAERVNAVGGKVINKVYPDLSHTDAVKVLSRFFDGSSELKADILAFIADHSGSGPNSCI